MAKICDALDSSISCMKNIQSNLSALKKRFPGMEKTPEYLELQIELNQMWKEINEARINCK